MQVKESPPATLVAQIDRGPDFVRPDESVPKQLIVLLTLVLCMRVDKCTAILFFLRSHCLAAETEGFTS